MCGDGGVATGEVHDAFCCIGELCNGEGKGLLCLIVATADGVIESAKAHGGERRVLNQEESGDIASGADRFVVDGLNIEGIGGKEVAAFAIGDDEVEGDVAVEIRVWSEGVVAGADIIGDEAIGA